MVAFQLAGKATRDALYLSTFSVTTLPRILILAALLSALFTLGLSRLMARQGPGRLIPPLFLGSAGLLLVEWLMARHLRPVAAVLFYLHYSALGALLVSGFWSMVTERFDPRAARRTIGLITVGASLGGLLGGLLPGWIGAVAPISTMLPLLAALHLLSAVLVLGIRAPAESPSAPIMTDRQPATSASAAFRGSRYLRWLTLLVVLTATAEALLDYVFKARASAAAPSGESLLHFFALFYTGTALAGITLQVLAQRFALGRLGVAGSAALLPAGVTLSTLGALFLPGLWPVLLARGSDVMLRNSLFRGAYELLFNPVLPREKHATKLLVDVGAARLGDATGALLIQLVLALTAASAGSVLLTGTMLLSLLALGVVRQLHAGYLGALARNIVQRVEGDGGVRASSTLLQTIGGFDLGSVLPPKPKPKPTPIRSDPRGGEGGVVPESRRDALQSGDPASVAQALTEGPLSPELVPIAVRLLAWDPLAAAARAALVSVSIREYRSLLRHLLNPEEDFAVRRRLVPILATCATPEVVEGLLQALGDRRFEVRYRVARALERIQREHPALRPDRTQVRAAVLAEVAVGRGLWESRRLIDPTEEEESPEDQLLRERADRSLEHVITLLTLDLPGEPLRLAYQALRSGDPHLRGTALEYLAGVIPEPIRARLWNFLEPEGPAAGSEMPDPVRAREALQQARESIRLALGALRQNPGER